MFVAGQQLTSLSPPKKPDVSVGFFAVKREILCNQNMIARGCAAELSVARSTMRVNSPVLAVRRISLSPPKKTDGTVGFLPSKERLQ